MEVNKDKSVSGIDVKEKATEDLTLSGSGAAENESNSRPSMCSEKRCFPVDRNDNVESEDSLQKPQEEADSDSMSITSLPEVALVKIMEYLSLKDRYHLTLTCNLFFDLFSHPNLWQKAHIVLSTVGQDSQNVSQWRLRHVMHETMAEIVRRFCHLFQYLTLEMTGCVQRFDKNCHQLLDDLIQECRLESLTLKLGSLASEDETVSRAFARRSNYKDLPLVVGLIHNATRLKRLSIISWPLHPGVGNDKNDIFRALLQNEKLHLLESLSLFYVEVKQPQWTERIPKLPSPETTLEVVTHFSSLSHLALRSPMVSDELLMELSRKGRTKLTFLQILIMFSRDSSFLPGYKIPELSPSAWSSLRTTSPHLKVEFLILTRIPHEELNLMLQPGIPVSSLLILDYGKCDGELINTVAEKYKKTLEKFVSKCDSTDCDEHLIKLVNSCSRLSHLVYHGDISYKTVMTMAEIIKSKGQELECFEIKEKNIQTSDETQNLYEDDGDNLTIARDEESQEYYLVGVRAWHRDDNEHRRKLDVMVDHVSSSLGYRWKPWVQDGN